MGSSLTQFGQPFVSRSRYVLVSSTPDSNTISFEPDVALTLGSKKLADEAARIVSRIVRGARPIEYLDHGGRITATFPMYMDKRLSDVLTNIDNRLDWLRSQRLYPKVVEEILGITSAERIRWTKDGRLKSSGRASFSQGRKSVSLFLYDRAYIKELAGLPDVRRQWRKADT